MLSKIITIQKNVINGRHISSQSSRSLGDHFPATWPASSESCEII